VRPIRHSDGLPGTGRALSAQAVANYIANTPPSPRFPGRDAAEGVVRQAERAGQVGALAVAVLGPRLGQHDDVGMGVFAAA